MINITDKRDCCGCNACVQVCPVKCIDFVKDKEGFSYPKIHTERCINCGLCEKVCPFLQLGDDRLPLATYAAKNTDEGKQRESSSGGIFIVLAEHVIRQGGVVFGVRFDEKWDAVYDWAETNEGLKPFMGSKYVQASVGDSFKIAKQFLSDKRMVLFTGTPCQIKSLKLYLRKDYENLIAVDVSCHGVPSPGIWHDYISDITGGDLTQIGEIKFRSKDGFDWNKFGFVIKPQDKTAPYIKCVEATTDLYIKAFLDNLTLRPSCYGCRCKGGKSLSDITLADFWGIDKVDPRINDQNGVSLVLANTPKGESILQQLSIVLTTVPYDKAYAYNLGLWPHTAYNIERKSFFRQYARNKNLIKLLEKYTGKGLSDKIRRRLKKYLYKTFKL